jgi:hypothetical protein
MALLIIFSVIVLIAAAILYGGSRWDSSTKDLLARLEAARVSAGPRTYDPGELASLPAPVQRYFRAVLTDGQPIVAAVTVEHAGTFNMSAAGEKWQPFTSRQRVTTQCPGFVWDARIAVAPGLKARVHDAYVEGEGILHATLLGFLTIVNMRGTRPVAEGELQRFFAETAWYPTALLPSQGVQWTAVDDTSAKAALKDGDISLTLLFRFDEAGLIASVRAEARARTVGGRVIPTPWEGRWRNYEIRDGMRVPLEGEVAWILPEGPKPYWRGRVTSLSHEFVR